MTKNNLGKKGLISPYKLLSIIQSCQGWNSKRQKLQEGRQNSSAHWLVLQAHFRHLSFSPGPPAWGWHCQVGWAFLHQSAIMEIPHRNTHTPIWWRQLHVQGPSMQECPDDNQYQPLHALMFFKCILWCECICLHVCHWKYVLKVRGQLARVWCCLPHQVGWTQAIRLV